MSLEALNEEPKRQLCHVDVNSTLMQTQTHGRKPKEVHHHKSFFGKTTQNTVLNFHSYYQWVDKWAIKLQYKSKFFKKQMVV